MDKNKMSDIDYSLSSVDPNDRKGFFLKSILIGNLILSIYTGLLSYIGSDTGLSLHLLTKYSFGLKGSYLPSFITSITQIGWFGVGISMFAIPISNRFNINLYVIVLITGILMTSTAYFGMKSLTILSAIAVPAIAILGGLSLFIAIQSIGGFGKLYSITPTNPMNLITAITLCIGSFISGGTVTPDFTRFSRTKKIAVSTTVIAFFIGNSLMFLFGAIGAMVTGNSDIADVMFSQGLIIPAIIVLGLNIWTTNDNAIYTAGLGLSNITKVKKSKLVLISGLIGTLGSIWINNNFTAFLTLLNSMLPPIGGVVIADYFFIKKLKYNKIEVTKFKEINPIAIISFIIGFLVSNFISFGIPAINAIISTIIVYIIGMKIFKDKDV